MSEETTNELPVEESVIEAPASEAPEAPEAPVDSGPPRPEMPAETESKVHPAYEKLLAELPEAWHEKVIPHLQEQDKNFQSQLEKYSPLKEFMEYDPNVLRDSLKLADVAVNDPVSLYRNLADHLRSQGMLEEAAEADEVADEAEATGELQMITRLTLQSRKSSSVATPSSRRLRKLLVRLSTRSRSK